MLWFSLLLRFLNIPFLKDAETMYHPAKQEVGRLLSTYKRLILYVTVAVGCYDSWYLRYNALNEMELLRRKSEPPNLIRHTMAMRSCAHSSLWRMATRIFFAVQIWDLEPDIVSCGTWTATKSDMVLLRMLLASIY